MADPKIKIRRSATPNKVPSKDQLQLGELAINTYDGKLYLEQDQGGVGVGNTVIAVNPWSVGVGSTAYNTHFTAGKVGVGTTNAQYNLDVGGNVNFTGNLYQNGSLFTSGSTGVGIATAGGIAGYAATVIDFRGPGVTTAYYSSATGIGTVYFQGGGGGGGGGNASVTVSDSAPSSPSNGDLWFKSDVGELYLWYTDGSSNQWVEASGGSNTVITSDTAPSSPQDGDLWWNSNTGELKVYYNDGNSSQWVDANSEGGFVQYWTQTNTNGNLGVTTTGFVGIGTTTATDALTVSGNANVTGFLTATQLNGAVSSTGVNVTGVVTALNLISPVTSSGVNVTGVATALHLKGPLTSSGINVTGVSTFSNTVDINSNLDVSGNVTVGGVLTYEDVKNVDAIGVVTARTGIKVLAGGANIVDGTTTDELNVTGISTLKNTVVGGATTELVVHGDARITGVLSVGQGTLSINERDIFAVGVFTGANFKTGTSNLHSAGVEVAGVNVNGADTPIGLGATVYNSGLIVGKQGAEFQGVVTASSFSGSGANLTDVISGVGIGTEGGVVGYAATILHFKGAGVTTAYYSSTTGIGTIFFHSATTGGGGGGGANVTVSDTPPGSPSSGDLWWESDIGELKIYYSDGDSAQWVDASGADSLVQVGTSAPTGAVSGDLWFNSETGDFMVYYTDANSSAWISVNAVNSNTKWLTNATGIHTSSYVGIGTTTVTDALTVVGAADIDGRLIVSGITTFGSHVYHGDNDHAIFGDGSDLSLYHDSTNSWIKNTTGNLTLNSNIIHLKDGGNNKNYLRTYQNDRIELYFNNGEKFRTTSTGVSISGNNVVSGNLTAVDGTLSGDLDVDGHTNLDNVSIAGVTTFANTARFSGDVNIVGTLTYEDVKNVDSIGIITARAGIVAQDDVKFTGATSGRDILWDKSADELKINDNTKISLGTDRDLQLSHNNSDSVISHIGSATGNLKILSGGAQSIECVKAGAVTIAHNGNTKLATTSGGISVTGTGTFSDDVTVNGDELFIADSIKHVGDIDTALRFPAADTFTVETAGSERLRITSTGAVGIGTDAPQRIIHAFEPTGNNLLFLESGDTNVDIIQSDTGGSTRIRNSQGSLVFYVNGDASSNNAANAVAGLTIDGDKDVHVYDDLFIPDKIIHEGDTNTSIRFPDDDTISFETAGSPRAFINSAGDLTIGGSAGTLGKVYIKQAADTDTEGFTLLNSGGTNSFRLFLGDSSGAVAHIGHGGQKQFNITQAGKVGIGVTNPVQKLSVFGNIYQRTGDVITWNNGDCQIGGVSGYNFVISTYTGSSMTEKLRVTSGGSVNIGGNFTQTTYNASITTGTVNKKISFGAAAHNDLSNEGSGIFFSRQNDGSAELSGLFSHSNGGFGIATREDMTFHTGGGSTYGSAIERLRIKSTGELVQYGFTGSSDGSADDLVLGNTTDGVNRGMTIWSHTSQNGNIAFADNDSNWRGAVQYLHGDDSMRLIVGGSERLQIDSNGRLTLKNNSGKMIDCRTSSGTGNCWISLSKSDGTNKGYFGYGSSSNEQLYIVQQENADITIYNGSASRWYFKTDGQLNSATDGAINVFGGADNHSNDAIIYADKTSSADWGILSNAYTNNYGMGIYVGNGASYGLAIKDYTNSAWRFRVNGAGTIYATNTTVASISDQRLKENIVDANSQWDDIKALRFRNFKWKADSGYADGKTYLGLISQEVETISPGLVEINAQSKEDIENEVPDPEYKNVKYSIVWMKAMKALQEAQARIETLEAKVATLEGS